MGEFSTMSAIKSILNNEPSFGVRGIKISEHLKQQFEKLNINIGKEAEIDLITIFCNGNGLNLIFGECKVMCIKLWQYGLWSFMSGDTKV